MSPDRPLVIVTGSGGFLGRALIARLVERFTVVGLEAVMPVASPSSFETIFTDLTSDDSVRAAFERVRSGYGASIAAVVHLAAYYDLSGDPSPKYQAVTVEGTRRLLHALQSFEIERLIFASTLLVHASGKRGQKINEDSPLDPRTPYPASKLATEQVLHDERGKVPIAILRLAGVYDENTSAVFLAQQIANIFERTLVSHVYPGDLSAGQPNLHIDDMVDAMLRVIDRRASLPDEVTLLIGETETLGYGDLQQRFGRLIHDEDWETREIPKALAKSGQWVQEDVLDQDPFVQPWMIDQSDTHYELDVSRAEQLIGWRPQHAMSAKLPEMIAALKKDPPRWYKTNKLNPAKVAAAGTEWTRESPEDAAKREAKSREVERHLQREHAETLWAPLTNIALGLWLAASPIAFGLFDGPSDAMRSPAGVGLDAAAARRARCVARLQRDRDRRTDRRARAAVAVAQVWLVALGACRRRHLADVRAARVLDHECGCIHQRFDRRRVAGRIRGADRHAAWYFIRCARDRDRHAARLDLLAVELRAARADRRAGFHRVSGVSIYDGVSARPHRRRVGSSVR